MQLTTLDWAIIVAYFALSLGIGIAFSKRAGSSFVEFFASGRSLPWWIAGTSMVATTFAADTPLAVTGLVAKRGLAGNWFWWAFALGGMLTVFVFAKLWRRAEVLTDVELIELRYGGPAARALRVFRGVYIAVVMNSIIIGWVTKAMASVLKQTVLFDAAATPAAGTSGSSMDFWLVAIMLLATGVYSILSGMWGVAITDVIQFVLALAGCVALAIVAVDHVGGTDALREQVTASFPGGAHAFDFVPDFSAADPWMPLGVFLVMVFCQWWATWYPGAEPGGGGYIVQRMASCRDERHAVKATLWFQLAHYCLRPWPWILVAFAALAMYPQLRDVEDAGIGFPMVMRDLAPVGLRGLLLVTFFAAFMSTISTQMNWGASYLVNDVYRRFLRPTASDRELARASRGASALVLLLGGIAGWVMVVENVSVDDAWKFLAALGAGVGLVFMLRWFWWRINAWSEIAAMVGSLGFFALMRTVDWKDEYRQLAVALLSAALWLAVTFLTRPERDDVLLAFYRKVRPDGPGWRPLAARAPEVRPDRTLGRSVLCALLGTAIVWSALPGVGAVIFGDWDTAATSIAIALVAGIALFRLLPGLQPRATRAE
ncbi:MAG: Na+:solute symporter [Planctomycetes bacterium]|nr:Na+:solute symporter [Planctomycetota bacterium]